MNQGEEWGTIDVRQHNLRTLLRHVHRHGPTTRAELGRMTGLTRSAVADLVAELVARDLVLETPVPAESTRRGRPGLVVAPRNDSARVLAISIRAEILHTAWVGLGGTVEHMTTVRHESVPDDPGPSLNQLAKLVASQMDVAATGPLAVGVAVPGLVQAAEGVVALAPRLGWQDVPLAEELRRRIGLTVPVVIGNDSNLAALAEHVRGAGRGHDNMIYLEAGLGVGGGIIVNGQLLQGGPRGYAGEVGHMVIGDSTTSCYCGGHGCWQTQVGGDALLRRAGLVFTDSRDRRTALDEMVARVDSGDPAALATLAELVPSMGAGIATLLAIFDPDETILEGLFAVVLRHFGESLRAAIDEGGPTLAAIPANLVPGQLGDNARLMGAAEGAIDAFLNQLVPYVERIRVPDPVAR
jgi:predicted NBD/HSP70 family sugar kinase